jgi:hypothetical protein
MKTSACGRRNFVGRGHRQLRRRPRDAYPMAERRDDLDAAFDRIEDFLAVQAGRSGGEMMDAVECLQLAVGIDEQARRVFADRLKQVSEAAHPGGVLLGVILGLFAAEATDQ